MKAYAKTGTSSESNDLWMVAGTPYYVGSVWYGFDLQKEVSNGGAAAKIWKDVMRDVHKGLEKKEFEDSEDVVKKGVGYYKKNGKMDNPIYQSDSSSKTSSQSSNASSAVSSAASSASSSETPSNPSESTATEPNVPPESSTPSEPSVPSEPSSSEPSSSSATASTSETENPN